MRFRLSGKSRKCMGEGAHSTRMKNIELKARCPNLDEIRAKAKAFGATFAETLNQTDTFFFSRSGRLKLREINGNRSELIAYHRGDNLEARPSEYTIVPVSDPDSLKQALTRTLGVKQQVIKTRELWLWRNVRIHLDQVKGLGSFLEFEAVVSPEVNENTSSKNVAELRVALGIHDHQLIGQSYADLLGQKIGDV
jgi:predicted adenylyl cyclase CyaB